MSAYLHLLLLGIHVGLTNTASQFVKPTMNLIRDVYIHLSIVTKCNLKTKQKKYFIYHKKWNNSKLLFVGEMPEHSPCAVVKTCVPIHAM